MSKKSIIIAMACFLWISSIGGCPRGKDPSGNEPPEVQKVTISPKSAMPGTVLRCSATLFDQEGDAVDLAYEWYVNGTLIPEAKGIDFDTNDYVAGDKIYAKVCPREKESGRTGKCDESTKITLGELPSLTLKGVRIEPEQITIAADAEAVVDYGDLDEMDVDDIYYQWYVNGQLLEDLDEFESTLSTDYFATGDKIQVKVCTDGAFDSGTTTASAIYTVLNKPPVFVGDAELEWDGETLYLTLEAEDPEGDDLEWVLFAGPPGAYIEDGVVYIDRAKVKPGKYRLEVGVSDEYTKDYSRYKSTITVPK